MRGDCCHGVATGTLTGLRRPPSHSRRRGDCCIGEGRGPGPGQNFRNPGREQERASRQARLLEAFQSRHQVGVSVGFRFELPANRGLSRSHKRRHRGRAVGPYRRFQRWSALVFSDLRALAMTRRLVRRSRSCEGTSGPDDPIRDQSASRRSAAQDRDAVCAGQQRHARIWAIAQESHAPGSSTFPHLLSLKAGVG